MTLTLLSPPAAEPVTLVELKTHLRVTHDDEDTLIASVLAAAVRAVEARGGLALIEQQWRLTLDKAPTAPITLPITPCTALDAVTVTDAESEAQAVSPALYDFAAGAPGRLQATGGWPAPAARIGGVAIDFTAGYADADAVPEPLKQAVKILAAYFYENREAASETKVYAAPHAVDALIAPYREVRI